MSALYVSIFTALIKKGLLTCLDSACLKTTVEKDMLILNFVTAFVPMSQQSL